MCLFPIKHEMKGENIIICKRTIPGARNSELYFSDFWITVRLQTNQFASLGLCFLIYKVRQLNHVKLKITSNHKCTITLLYVCSVTKSCPALCKAHWASLSFTLSWRLVRFMSIESVILSSHLILCCPLLLLPSIFPSIRVFSNKSALCIRWPKYWSFSFSSALLPKEYGGVQLLAAQKPINKPGWWKWKSAIIQKPATGGGSGARVVDICPPALATSGARAFIDRDVGVRGLRAEKAQSALMVIFWLVISGLTGIMLVVLGTVNLQFQGPLVLISLWPVLGTVRAHVLGAVWPPCS